MPLSWPTLSNGHVSCVCCRSRAHTGTGSGLSSVSSSGGSHTSLYSWHAVTWHVTGFSGVGISVTELLLLRSFDWEQRRSSADLEAIIRLLVTCRRSVRACKIESWFGEREGRRNINIILCCSLFVRQYHFEQYGSCIIQQGFGEFQTLRFAIDKILRILWLSRVSEILITFTTNWEQSFITLKDSFAGIEKVCRFY